MAEIKLQELAGGALEEMVQEAAASVVQNMQDPNTPWKNKRGITIKLAFAQNEDRDDATCEISVEKKLAPVKPVQTKFFMGSDLENGGVLFEEYGPQIRGQMSITDYCKGIADESPEIIGEDVVDTETGEVVGKVTDFRAKEA